MNTVQVPFEIKALDDTGKFSGYASVFDVKDSDNDVIMKGAFTDTIKSNKSIKMLWQHDHKNLIGKFTEVLEDDRGLKVTGELVMDVQQAKEAHALMKSGVLDGMSVGFNIKEAKPNKSHGLDIKKLDLWEISLVTWGANPQALISQVKSIKDFEGFLRDAGYSRKQAKGIASRGYKAINDDHCDDDLLDAIKTLNNQIKGNL